MNPPFLLSCGLILTLIGVIAPLSAQSGNAGNAGSAKPKMIILPARVTVDGLARPDLGQSLSDVITAKLLTTSAVELLDADTPISDPIPHAVAANAPDAGASSSPSLATPQNSPPIATGLPAPTPIGTGLARGADLVVQTTVVGHANEFRLTLREIQIPGGKVISIITEKTGTGLKGLYALAENHALRLVPAPPPVPRQNAGPAIIDHPARYRPDPPITPGVSEQDIAQAPPALGKLSSAKQVALAATMRLLDPAASATGPTPIGRIGGLDLSWSFCTITLKQPLDLPLGTALFACAGRNPESVVDLSVSRLEGRKIIADIVPGPSTAGLRSGDIVYHWKPSPAAVP